MFNRRSVPHVSALNTLRKNDCVQISGREQNEIEVFTQKTLQSMQLTGTSIGHIFNNMLLKIFLAVFENRALGTIFGPKRDEVKGNGKDQTTRNFMLCIPNQFFFRVTR